MGGGSRGSLYTSALLAVLATGLMLVPPVNFRVAALLPSLYGPAIDRLPGRPAGPKEPAFSVPIDVSALRRAARVLPRGAPYYIHAPARGLLPYNLQAAATLYLPDALRVARPEAARWILLYRRYLRAPAGLRGVRVHRLGDDIYLVRVRRR